jgi:prophage regulatory protein
VQRFSRTKAGFDWGKAVNKPTEFPARTLLNVKQVAAKLSIGESTVHKLVDEGKFPAPFTILSNSKRWVEAQIDEVIARWIVESQAKEPRAQKSCRQPRPDASQPASKVNDGARRAPGAPKAVTLKRATGG